MPAPAVTPLKMALWKRFDFEGKLEKRHVTTVRASKFYVRNRNFMNVVRTATRT
jgi:hypothetical protein